MRYWDASAIVPLVVAEPDSELVRTWLSEEFVCLDRRLSSAAELESLRVLP